MKRTLTIHVGSIVLWIIGMGVIITAVVAYRPPTTLCVVLPFCWGWAHAALFPVATVREVRG